MPHVVSHEEQVPRVEKDIIQVPEVITYTEQEPRIGKRPVQVSRIVSTLKSIISMNYSLDIALSIIGMGYIPVRKYMRYENMKTTGLLKIHGLSCIRILLASWPYCEIYMQTTPYH